MSGKAKKNVQVFVLEGLTNYEGGIAIAVYSTLQKAEHAKAQKPGNFYDYQILTRLMDEAW